MIKVEQLCRCAHSEGQAPTEFVWSSSLVEKKYNKKYFRLQINVDCSTGR